MKDLAVVLLKDKDAQLMSQVTGEHNLIFPLADMDLEKFLDMKNFSKFDFKYLVRECFHLADALVFLHTGIQTPLGNPLTCCHMDLSPRNILVCLPNEMGLESKVGIWKITDFITSTLTDENGDDLFPAPRLVPDICVPPEIDSSHKIKADTASDIWSFECVLFKVLIGYVFGEKRNEAWKDGYGNSRCFYDRDVKERVVERRVSEWLNEEDSKEKRVILCKRLVLDMLNVALLERLKAEEVRERLAMILVQS
jgi:serine/threonine protein kinase